MSGINDPNAGNEHLPCCFFIYDDFHKDEMAKDDDLILFFHPQHVDIGKRLQLMGACDAMISFANTFTRSPARVIEMKKFKLTFRVLTAGADCSRQSLERQLEMILNAFQFYNHSIAEIEKQSNGSRKQFQQLMIRACTALVPMVQLFHTKLLQQFHPMPYSDLSQIIPKTGSATLTRFYAMAARLLSVAAIKEGSLGGCIVYSDNSVICTHLDLDSTRWIVNRIAVIEIRNGPGQENYTEDVYLKRSILDKLREMKSAAEEGNCAPAPGPVTPSKRTFTGGAGDANEPIKMSLFILRVGNLFMAMLSTPEAHQNQGYIKELISLGSQLTSIDKGLSSALQEYSFTVVSNSSDRTLRDSDPPDSIARLSSLHSPIPLKSSSGSLHRSGTLGSPRSVPSRGSSPSPTPQKSPSLLQRNSAPSTSYNFLTFNSLSQTQNVSFGIKRNDSERHFYRVVSNAHDVFYENPMVSKLVLRDPTSTTFCRSLFGKETYYEQPANFPFKTVEDAARDNLGSGEHNITMI